MIKLIISFVFLFAYSNNIYNQISLDSVLSNAINKHFLEIKSAVNNHSDGKLYFINDPIFYDFSVTPNLVSSFEISTISFNEFKSWNKKQIGKSKMVIYFENILFQDNKINFLVIAGILTIVKKKTYVQSISENIVSVYYDCDAMSWKYKF